MMTHDEYLEKLNALRKKYADVIRLVASDTEDDFRVIFASQAAAEEYQDDVDALIAEYHAANGISAPVDLTHTIKGQGD